MPINKSNKNKHSKELTPVDGGVIFLGLFLVVAVGGIATCSTSDCRRKKKLQDKIKEIQQHTEHTLSTELDLSIMDAETIDSLAYAIQLTSVKHLIIQAKGKIPTPVLEALEVSIKNTNVHITIDFKQASYDNDARTILARERLDHAINVQEIKLEKLEQYNKVQTQLNKLKIEQNKLKQNNDLKQNENNQQTLRIIELEEMLEKSQIKIIEWKKLVDQQSIQYKKTQKHIEVLEAEKNNLHKNNNLQQNENKQQSFKITTLKQSLEKSKREIVELKKHADQQEKKYLGLLKAEQNKLQTNHDLQQHENKQKALKITQLKNIVEQFGVHAIQLEQITKNLYRQLNTPPKQNNQVEGQQYNHYKAKITYLESLIHNSKIQSIQLEKIVQSLRIKLFDQTKELFSENPMLQITPVQNVQIDQKLLEHYPPKIYVHVLKAWQSHMQKIDKYIATKLSFWFSLDKNTRMHILAKKYGYEISTSNNKQAYNTLVKVLHPDKGGSKEGFQELNDIYNGKDTSFFKVNSYALSKMHQINVLTCIGNLGVKIVKTKNFNPQNNIKLTGHGIFAVGLWNKNLKLMYAASIIDVQCKLYEKDYVGILETVYTISAVTLIYNTLAIYAPTIALLMHAGFTVYSVYDLSINIFSLIQSKASREKLEDIPLIKSHTIATFQSDNCIEIFQNFDIEMCSTNNKKIVLPEKLNECNAPQRCISDTWWQIIVPSCIKDATDYLEVCMEEFEREGYKICNTYVDTINKNNDNINQVKINSSIITTFQANECLKIFNKHNLTMCSINNERLVSIHKLKECDANNSCIARSSFEKINIPYCKLDDDYIDACLNTFSKWNINPCNYSGEILPENDVII